MFKRDVTLIYLKPKGDIDVFYCKVCGEEYYDINGELKTYEELYEKKGGVW
jgi:YgiT-type zinc finger domain-containing protein